MLARGKISWSAEVISKVLHFKCSFITAECRNANHKTQDNTGAAIPEWQVWQNPMTWGQKTVENGQKNLTNVQKKTGVFTITVKVGQCRP